MRFNLFRGFWTSTWKRLLAGSSSDPQAESEDISRYFLLLEDFLFAAFRKGLSLGDNLNCQFFEYRDFDPSKLSTPFQIPTAKLNKNTGIEGIVLLQSTSPLALTWQNQNELSITFHSTLSSPPTNPIEKIRLAVFFKSGGASEGEA